MHQSVLKEIVPLVQVVEVCEEMSPKMAAIQQGLLTSIRQCLQELKRCVPNVCFELTSMHNVVC